MSVSKSLAIQSMNAFCQVYSMTNHSVVYGIQNIYRNKFNTYSKSTSPDLDE